MYDESCFVCGQVLGQDWADHTSAVTQQLRDLGLGAVSEEAYTTVLKAKLEMRVRARGERCFDTPLLGPTLAWLDAVPLNFLRLLLPKSARPNSVMSLALPTVLYTNLALRFCRRGVRAQHVTGEVYQQRALTPGNPGPVHNSRA